MLKCENYLTAITNRSRNLIQLRSNQHLPNWEVLFRIAILDPIERQRERKSKLFCMLNMCVCNNNFNEARELDDKMKILNGSAENEMEKLKFKIHSFSPFISV